MRHAPFSRPSRPHPCIPEESLGARRFHECLPRRLQDPMKHDSSTSSRSTHSQQEVGKDQSAFPIAVEFLAMHVKGGSHAGKCGVFGAGRQRKSDMIGGRIAALSSVRWSRSHGLPEQKSLSSTVEYRYTQGKREPVQRIWATAMLRELLLQ
ncbi:uncharacterized protein B0I36DRAFT_65407 [Microdochium trichocladiopsis]|uniref:Uncharacterized protein n=1 Tax=Microdochium trichocladiopsis TaxID=1682393 RepID=A0A9P9BUE6_9PEZI|nr:uncharacterized protein B0I36DRAFT_65407 [Microdochium trichocladiopsis]KAH7037394.1 hypothetical protein B0I36DRAFT_65407 [Microdochium trichocladiopsis]